MSSQSCVTTSVGAEDSVWGARVASYADVSATSAAIWVSPSAEKAPGKASSGSTDTLGTRGS